MKSIVQVAALLLGACGRQPPPFAPPPQREASPGRDPGELGSYIHMGDPFAAEYIVRDVSPENSEWRWTFVRPELKLRAQRSRNLKFEMDFAVPAVTLRQTGPILVTCFIDGRSLGPMRVADPGRHRYQKNVPDGWVQVGVPVSVSAEVDKRFVAKDDGAQLSFLLGAIGFMN